MPEQITWLNVGRNQEFKRVGVAGTSVYRVQIPNGEIWELYNINAINKTRNTGYCAIFLRDTSSTGDHTLLKVGAMENYGDGCTLIWNGQARARYDVNAEITLVTASDDIRIRINYRRGWVKDV